MADWNCPKCHGVGWICRICGFIDPLDPVQIVVMLGADPHWIIPEEYCPHTGSEKYVRCVCNPWPPELKVEM